MSEPPAEGHKPRSRFRRQIEAGMALTERDRELLAGLFLHRAMRRDQLEELYFSSTPRANARLRLLFDHGYLLRYFPPEAPFGAQAIYSIAMKAVPVVARHLEWEEGEVRSTTRKSPTPQFREHTLAIVDLFLALRREAAGHQDVELIKWLPEIMCRHEYEIRKGGQGPWRREVFKPDGYFRLAMPTGLIASFLEVDRGHTSFRQFAAKLSGYGRYRDSGLYEKMYQEREIQVLVITTGERRTENLKKAVPKDMNGHMCFITHDVLESKGLLAAILASA